jgi:aminocarboxymuconate-semialdehyde decarboxylase
MIIDAHAHYVPWSIVAALQNGGLRQFPSVQMSVEGEAVRFAFAGDQAKRPVPKGMHDAQGRRKWLSDHRVDKQVVGGWLDMFGYDIPADEGADWSRFLNEQMLKGVRNYSFFVPLATVPMQSGRLAAKVLSEALDAGFHGAMIGTQPKGAKGVLDDPDLDAFWEVASERKAALFVHPTFGARDDRLKDYGLVSAIGRLTDTSIAVARLLYSGHLLRYPGANLILSHGGAALPMALGRLRRSFATAPAENADPYEGFQKLYFDTVVYDPTTIRFVADLAGADKIVLGTDQPFVIGESNPVEFLESCKFDAPAAAAIGGGTAQRLFGIKD